MTNNSLTPCCTDQFSKLFEHIFSSSNDAILIAEIFIQPGMQRFIFTYSNRSATILTGYTPEELHGIDFCMLFDLSGPELLYQKVIEIASPAPVLLKVKMTGKNLIEIPVELTIRSQEFDGALNAVIIVRQISENKNINSGADLLSEKPLLLADKMMSLNTLVAGMAHEINNPNNLIMLSTDVLREIWDEMWPTIEGQYQNNERFTIHGENKDCLNKNVLRLFDNIIDGAERISKIILAIRDFVRNDTSDKKTVFDIGKTVNSAIILTDTLIKKSTNNFKSTVEEGFYFVNGYQRQVQQAIINLITNACQALTEKSQGISITISELKESQMISLEITDEGEGIAEENLGHLFDLFFTTRRANGHIGLGLSTTYMIVEKHGGKINFNSRHGFQTTVTVKLPISGQ